MVLPAPAAFGEICRVFSLVAVGDVLEVTSPNTTRIAGLRLGWDVTVSVYLNRAFK